MDWGSMLNRRECTYIDWGCEAHEDTTRTLRAILFIQGALGLLPHSIFFLLWYVHGGLLSACHHHNGLRKRPVLRYCHRDSEAVVPSDLHGPARLSKLFVS